MTTVKDRRQPTTRRQRLDHQRMQIIIDDMPRRLEIQRINHLIIPVIFIPVQILRLASVSGIVEEEGIVRFGTGDEPLHCCDHVGSSRDLTRVAGVVDEHDDVVLFVPESVYHTTMSVKANRGLFDVRDVPHKNLDMLVASLMHPFNSELVPR